MHLQSLELLGFKSFADKTIFNFHEGTTAIVGPNGCGKSNVLDAVRWALGEQSAKSLRGDEMADVIFNGAETRKPVGVAEVSLTFTDCAEELGIEWHDVRVTRRVYRDGNSEYLLNKTPCRLRDIQNLFADTGIARAAYSMMEQGKIDMILSSRPEDRRTVFEEAAGITKYKAQKREALRKLEATDANLLRIGDVIKEVKRQIGSLQRQAGKARRYQGLHADLRVLETHCSRKQLDALEADLSDCHKEIELVTESERATRARLQELQFVFSKSESKISALQGELSGTKARRESTCAQIEQLAKEIQTLSSARDKLLKQITASLKTSRREAVDVEASLHKKEQLLSEAEENLAALERTLAEKRSRLEVLRQLNEEGEGLAQGSQAVLKGVDAAERFRDAIAGSLVAHLDVDPQFIPAIEAALGRNLHAVVLKDANVAFEIIAQLKKKKLGQAALLLPQLTQPAKKSVRKILPENALAWATDKLVAPQSLEPLIRQLLENVAIFSDLQQALECKKHEPALAMATLAGEFVSTEGILFGGSSEVRAASLLERKAQIAELAKEEAALAKQRDSLCAKRDEAKTAVEVALQLQQEFSEAERKIDNLRSEKNALERQVGAADERIAKLDSELQTQRGQLVREQTDLDAFETAQRETTLREEELSERINQLRLAVATGRQRHENLVARREPMGARDTELFELIAVRKGDIALYEQKLAAQADESRKSEVLIKNHSTQREEVQVNAAKIAEQRATRFAAISARETELRDLRDSLGELQDRRAQRQVRESQLQMKIDGVAEHISRSYQVDLREFAVDEPAFQRVLRIQAKRWIDRYTDATNGDEGADSPSRSENAIQLAEADLEKLVADLRTQLDNMGPVNLDAVHEYDELEERYKFLEAQNTDLTNSRRELLDVIAQINSTTRT